MTITVANVLHKFLSAVYILAGGMKVYPPTDAMKIDMNKTFMKFAEVCPTMLVGYKPNFYCYRVSLGWAELLLGLTLFLGPRSFQTISCYSLLVIMGGAVYTMIGIKEYSQIVVPASFFLMLSYYLKCLSNSDKQKSS